MQAAAPRVRPAAAPALTQPASAPGAATTCAPAAPQVVVGQLGVGGAQEPLAAPHVGPARAAGELGQPDRVGVWPARVVGDAEADDPRLPRAAEDAVRAGAGRVGGIALERDDR